MDYEEFAREWCEAWNARDVERVLDHFHETVVFTSPVAARMCPESAGRLEGKAALREYWVAALAQIPDLRFTVEQVFGGLGVAVIHYRDQNGVHVAEVLEFDGDKVARGHGTYPSGSANPAGLRDTAAPE